MTKEIEIQKSYNFFIAHLKNQFILAVNEEDSVYQIYRYTKVVLLIKSKPDQNASLMMRKLIRNFKKSIPEVFIKLMKRNLLPTCKRRIVTVGINKKRA